MFDSLYIPSGDHVSVLMKQGRVIHWVREAFGHCKAIGATGEGVKLVKMACELPGMLFSQGESGEVVDCYGVVTAAGVGRPTGVTEALKMVKGAKNFLDAYAFNVSQHRNFKRELDGLTSMVAY